jgi:hypothetical protein
LRFGGPWIEEIPELTSPSRVLPVVLPFAGNDRASIEIVAPAGYFPGPAPAPMRIESSMGAYTLAVTATESGFHVDRSLTLPKTEIPPQGYDAFRRFLEEVRVADRTSVTFTLGKGASP